MDSERETSIKEIIGQIVSCWGSITKEQYGLLEDNLQVRTFHKDESIYNEFEIPEELMFLVAGKVKVYKEGVGGRSQIMRVFKPGEFFGYRAYLAKQEYRTAATAFEDSMIAFLPITIFLKILKSNADVGMFFIRCLATELGNADKRTLNLTQKRVYGRLAEALLFLIDSFGIDDQNRIDVSISRADIASMSNMTTSNAIRTLSAFADRNIIATKGRKIRILDFNELRKVAELG